MSRINYISTLKLRYYSIKERHLMDITRQYVRQFLSESKKPAKKFEDSGYKYAYTTKDRAEDGGWEVQDSIEELEAAWDDSYGEFDPNNVLVMKPATSVDKAMVLSVEPNLGGDIIYPSIDAAINGSVGLYALGWEEGATLTQVTEEEVQELLQTKDLKRAEELLAETFVDCQDYGFFEGIYEYVSGPMPEENGVTPGRTLVQNKKQKASTKDFEYYRRKVLANPDNLEKVPDELITPELCKLAIEEDGSAIEYVPNELITPELCRIAVEESMYALKYVPDEFKTPELCKFAVEKDGRALYYVPDELKTLELCKLAVKKNSFMLKYVPVHLKRQVKQELRIK